MARYAVSKTHCWRLDARTAHFGSPEFDASVQLQELMRVLGPDAPERINRLVRSSAIEARFALAVTIISDIPALYFEPLVVEYVSRCGASLDCDVYVLGED